MKEIVRAGEDTIEPTDSPTAPTAVSHAQHSPLPWRAGPTDGIGQRGLLRVVDANGVQVADFEAPKSTPTTFVRHLPEDTANVALALRACNHHEALLAALKELLASSGDPNATSGEYDTATGRAYRAVQKAEGK